MSYTCSNCGRYKYNEFIVIPKGQEAVPFLMKETCVRCGCKTLRVKW